MSSVFQGDVTAQQIVGGELLIVASIESSLGHNRSGDWGYLRPPAIATTQALYSGKSQKRKRNAFCGKKGC